MTRNLDPSSSPYLRIYCVLDEVCFDGRIRPGVPSAIHSSIDALRKQSAPAEHIRMAESVSVALQRLERALQSGSAEDAEAARAELQRRGTEWRQTPLHAAPH